MTGVAFWPALLFWPAIVVGLLASCFGILCRRPAWLVSAAVLVLPASLYLTATPRFQGVGLLPLVFLVLAAYAVRRQIIWVGGLLVTGTVLFLSWVASIVYVPILIHVLVVGAAAGVVAARRVGWRLPIYVVIGIVGAFSLALPSFGDAPFLMRHSYLNPWTLSVAGAALLVTVTRAVDKRWTGSPRR